MGKRKWIVAACAALAIALVSGVAGHAQLSSSEGSLSLDRIAYVEPGTYLAGDKVQFDISRVSGFYLMRMRGSPEVFVLYVDHGSLGGRVLKYDSGETAMNVAGWGGMTLYTDTAPQGLPALRTGDVLPPVPSAVSIADMQSAASDDAERLAYVRRLNVQFTTDWNAFGDPNLRFFAFDTLENAARGIERFCAGTAARDVFVKRVSQVSIAQAIKPTIAMNGRTLVVTFNPATGYEGRASSRAIARALGRLFFH